MTRARTIALLLAAVALCAASPLAQAATTSALLEVPYGLGDGLGRDTSIQGTPSYDHVNHGANPQPRIVKGWQHTYLADWDTAPMQADIGPGGALMVGPLLGQPNAGTYGWGAYGPTYHLAIMPSCGTSVNDNGTPLDPLDDFINPILDSDWPNPAHVDAPVVINISSVWASTDWFEGPGVTGGLNYNWPTDQYASTIWYAGDSIIWGMEIPWDFPGGGDDGTGNPWPASADCTFIETFHTRGDYAVLDAGGGPGWEPWNGVPKTPTNSTSYSMDNSTFTLTDVNATPGDPLDDVWLSSYVELQLDQAMIDDMFNNPDHRGIALWEWTDWNNGTIYGQDQNADRWPYIQARIEAVSYTHLTLPTTPYV